jgi:predicted metal-dependent phosphoesterase TrpH
MLRGVIHTHSTYSDGEYTLRELREVLTADGCSFACMTDHAEFFDEEKLRAYVAECESLSDDRFRFVAGLEYECERRMHMLGYGVATLAGTTDPQAVIRHIEREGGVSVIAHPMDSMFDWIETFDTLPFGVEAWNTKYDGRYAPRRGTFQLIRRLQERKPELRAFYGTDFHWRHQHRGLSNVLTLAGTTDPQAVIRHIEREGGVSVIAHPMDSMFDWIETFETLPSGVEAWNTKYDGRYAPRRGTFQLIRRLRGRKPELRAFYGTDFHWRHQYRALSNVLALEGTPTRESVLAALRRGDFAGVKGELELPSSGELPDEMLARFDSVNSRYHLWRSLLKKAKKMSGRIGKRLPAPVKAQLRRIF